MDKHLETIDQHKIKIMKKQEIEKDANKEVRKQ